jgi:hypothetical protein
LNKIIALLILLILPSTAGAAEELLGRPRWSLELKGGVFAPSLGNWSSFYGKKAMPAFATSLAYKYSRRVEIGAEAGTSHGKGQAVAVLHGTPAGSVTYDLYPVNLFVLTRFAQDNDQWMVPYVGGGLTRMYYRQKIEGLDAVRGSADGFHVRGGLQFSLDNIDVNASNAMYNYYRVLNSWFFIEAEYIRAIVHSVSTDLGGTAYRAGLLFEF